MVPGSLRPLEVQQGGRDAGQVPDAPVTNLRLVQVIGWDNGGVEIACLECGELMAAGGCSCCEGNQITLLDLVKSAREHICKEST
jgi:hypothetical protein